MDFNLKSLKGVNRGDTFASALRPPSLRRQWGKISGYVYVISKFFPIKDGSSPDTSRSVNLVKIGFSSLTTNETKAYRSRVVDGHSSVVWWAGAGR